MKEREELIGEPSEPAGDELTLDPEDWAEFRAEAHRMLDGMLEHMATLRDQPVWQPVPREVRERLSAARLPLEATALPEVYREFVTDVLPYTSGNRHPRAWGWVRGNGTPVAMLAEMLAAGMNAHVGGGHSAPVLVEEQVLGWIRQMMGMPEGASGVLTSGGSMANLLAFAVARHAKAGPRLREQGLTGLPRMLVYCSRETHFWVRKAVHLLGMGSASLREIGVDDAYRIDTAELARTIASDRRAGYMPIAVIGNAGTVNTGAFDDLLALRALCDAEDLWLHVDGAFGAWLQLVPEYRHLVDGMVKADSLALDLHKWMYLPFETGCLLVRDKGIHESAFRVAAAYMEPDLRGPLSGGIPFADRGVESSRSFKALKVWMSLKTHGMRRLAALVEQNLTQARFLAQAIEQQQEQLCLLAPCTSNLVCFAYTPGPGAALSASELDDLQRAIVLQLAEQGHFLVSGTTLATAEGKRYAIRVAITNHRTMRVDLEELVKAVLAAGQALCREPRRFDPIAQHC